MTQLGEGLRILTTGKPTGSDLVSATQQTAALMAQLQPQILRMSPTQRQQAFQLEQELMLGIAAVQSAYVYQRASCGPTVAWGTSTIVAGTPMVVIGTPMPPSPPLATAELIANELRQLQLNAVEMAAGKPDDGAITVWLASMGSVISTIRQLVFQADPTDLDLLGGGVAQAMTAMIGAMQSYVSQ